MYGSGVQDCWHENYYGAPGNGTAWKDEGGGECRRRVIRGGSWFDKPEDLRSSDRGRRYAVHRSDRVGFRLAQDVD